MAKSNGKIPIIDMSAMDKSKMDRAFEPYPLPNPEVENIGIPLAGLDAETVELMYNSAVTVWMRNVGLIEGTKLLVPSHVLAMHGQHVTQETPEGHRPKYFMWDNKPVVLAIYH